MPIYTSTRFGRSLPISIVPTPVTPGTPPGKGGQGRGKGKGGNNSGSGNPNIVGAVAYWHKESTGGSNVSSVTVLFDATIRTGDILFGAAVHHYTTTCSTPAGWTLLGVDTRANGLGGENTTFFWKISDGTETQVVFSQVSASSPMCGAVICSRGYDTLLDYAATGETTSGGVDVIGVPLEGVIDGGLAISIATCSTNSGTVSSNCDVTGSGWQKVLDNNTTNNPNGKKNMTVATNALGGDIVSPTFTWNQQSENRSVGNVWLRKTGSSYAGDADPYFSSVVLLSHFNLENTSYKNYSSYTNSLFNTKVATVASTATQVKFGVGALEFTGASPSLRTATHTDWDIGTNDFTIEFWFWQIAAATKNIFDMRQGAGQATSWRPCIYTTAAGGLNYFANGADRITSAASALSTGAWHHIALSRVSGNTRLFIDGTQVGSTFADSNTYLGSNYVWLGSYTIPATNVFYDDFRFSNGAKGAGAGRYAANFTPPTAAFPNK